MADRAIRWLMAAPLLPLIACIARYAPAAEDAGYRLRVKRVETVVQADGTSTSSVHNELQVLTAAAATRLAQVPISYSEKLTDLDITDAYTQKTDGRKVPVDKASIVTQPAPGQALATLYTDQRQKVIIFPDVQAGDTLVFDHRVHVRQALFPQQYAETYLYRPDWPVEDEAITISVPSAMAVEVASQDIAVQKRVQGDRVLYSWRREQPAAAAADVRVIFRPELIPHVYLSTFDGYDGLQQAFTRQILPSLKESMKVRQQAETLTAGITDRREQARALYDWVTLHVRYVGLELGAGGLVPHEPEWTLNNAFGDCKDHTLLYIALLKAKGIDAQPALITTDTVYSLLPLPAPNQFNHMIAWLPEFQLYADTTSGIVSFGLLPMSEYGKPVLLLGTSGPSRRQIPPLAPHSLSSMMRTQAHINQQGQVTVDAEVSATGAVAANLRRLALQIQASGSKSVAESMLKQHNMPRASGDFTLAQPLLLSPQYALGSHFQTAGHIVGNLVPVLAALRVSSAAGDVLAGPLDNTKLGADEPTPCYSGHQVEELSLDFPSDREVLRLPVDSDLQSGPMRYVSHWSREGQTIKLHREFETTFDQALCTGELRHQAAALLEQIRRDRAAPLVLTQ